MGDFESAHSGASPEAVRKHYDRGNGFFRLWLDDSMTYSCAMYESEDQSLEAAQMRKLDYHVAEAGAAGAARVLDVGCGWGSLLERLVAEHDVEEVVGLTLSKEQAHWLAERRLPQASVRIEHWADHQPERPYDAIISLGALEHFVRPEHSADQRIEIYRKFFSKCREMLRPGGGISLQTSAYNSGGFVTGAIASIFPESDLPRLSQLAEAAEDVLEIVSLRNDRMDYARTCTEWLSRLRAHKEEAIETADGDTYARYVRFLAAARSGFEMNVFGLLRMTLRRPES